MLVQRFSEAQVAGWLRPREEWSFVPTARERGAWDGLPESIRQGLIARGEQALEAEWPALPATLYLDYARTGNRRRYETQFFARRAILRDLVLAECAEGQGRFADALSDAVWATCEESSWCFPAHLYQQAASIGLPDVAEPTVDLFAAETAAALAWTAAVLGETLNGVSPLLVSRLAGEVRTRILAPCLAREDYWWMGLRGGGVNNWNPWIISNWLACALLLEDDPARRAAAVWKGMRCLDVFIDSYPEDGGCDEGPSYWGRAGASLFDCLELLHSATGGRIDLFGEENIRQIGRFIYRAHIAERWFINFADAPARLTPGGGLIYRYGKAIDDSDMRRFGAYALTLPGSGEETLPRALPALFVREEMAQTPPTPPLVRDVWLPETQVMVARSRDGSAEGLCCAAKGGHNAESHNHNDVGHFLVYADGRPVLIDVGVETYSRKTFSKERYSIWTMQSQYHNLPTVNGVMQAYGRDFAARELDYTTDHTAAHIRLDLAGAYPAEAGIARWQRTFTAARAGWVTVEDAWRLRETPSSLVFHLVTPCAVTLGDGVITLAERGLAAELRSGAGVIHYPAEQLDAVCEEIAVGDPQLQGVWGERLYRVNFTVRKPEAEGCVQMRVEVSAQ